MDHLRFYAFLIIRSERNTEFEWATVALFLYTVSWELVRSYEFQIRGKREITVFPKALFFFQSLKLLLQTFKSYLHKKRFKQSDIYLLIIIPTRFFTESLNSQGLLVQPILKLCVWTFEVNRSNLDTVGTVCHLVIYMQSNKIHKVSF